MFLSQVYLFIYIFYTKIRIIVFPYKYYINSYVIKLLRKVLSNKEIYLYKIYINTWYSNNIIDYWGEYYE